MFGHVLTETLCRCWFLLQENISKKILFTTITSKVPSAFYEFLRLLGIRKEQIIVVSKVTQVKSILIPDQSLMLFSWYMDRWIDVYCCMRENVLKELKQAIFPNKLYLTRSQLPKKDCIGEEYFEDFYQKRGYEIVAPETLSLIEQIALIYNAKEIICTVGILSHIYIGSTKHWLSYLKENNIS